MATTHRDALAGAMFGLAARPRRATFRLPGGRSVLREPPSPGCSVAGRYIVPDGKGNRWAWYFEFEPGDLRHARGDLRRLAGEIVRGVERRAKTGRQPGAVGGDGLLLDGFEEGPTTDKGA